MNGLFNTAGQVIKMNAKNIYMKELLDIAEEIIKINKNNGYSLALTGSLMLNHRGIETRRKPEDIDFIVNDYAGNCKMPDGAIENEYLQASDGTGLSFVYKGVKIDIMSSGEDGIYSINGVLCGSIDNEIGAKMRFANNDLTHESRKKHIQDLEYMGYDPEEFLKQKTFNYKKDKTNKNPKECKHNNAYHFS